MGNVEAAVVRNVDKRTSRREHRAIFDAAVQRFRNAPFAAPESKAGIAPAERNVRVCIRKRPMFPHEREQCEFDVITCLGGRVVVHDARMHPDMVHLFMNHHDFNFDEAFGENASNDEVYAGTARNLVMESLRGGSSTVMMYGQTGSGKTYTMSAIHERVAHDIFANNGGKAVTACFVELFGDNCFDMFNQGAPCTLSSAADGSVHPYPSVEVPVENPNELLALLELASKLRATAATGVHDQSSRSHAVCRVFVDCSSEDGAPDSEGCLTLVDLAGSEHRVDSAEHNAERRKEGAKINASLAALKECIRATAAGAKFIAFRQNRLTQLLRGCFAGADQHHTVVIATASPSSKDTEHTLNTLRHACIMDGQGESKSQQSAHVTGGVVTKEKLGEIDVAGIARERRAKQKSEPAKEDEWGKPPPAHQAKQSNTGARAALDARCVRALPQNLARALLEARQCFGTQRQRIRLTRAPPTLEQAEVQHSDCRRRASSEAEIERTNHPRSPARRATEGDATNLTTDSQNLKEDASHVSVSSDHDRALELFRLFCTRGRDAHAWRKNDLRLINTCVVRILYGNDAQLDWAHPNIALDQLEALVSDAPPPAHILGDSGDKLVTKPPSIPSSASAPSQVGKRSARRDDCKPPVLPANNSAPSTSAGRTSSAGRTPLGDNAQRARSASSQVGERANGRNMSPSSRGSSADARPPMTHQDAIRARREALEKARQETLQKALSKNDRNAAMSREDEIASISAQLEENRCSAAAAVGLKKRLAALKATAIREERNKKIAFGAVYDEPSVNEQATPEHCNEAKENPSAERRNSSSDLHSARTHQQKEDAYSPPQPVTPQAKQDDWWPEPARPPPRNVHSTPVAVAFGNDGLQVGPCRSEIATGARQASLAAPSNMYSKRGVSAQPVGAASAPWANDFSNDGLMARG